MLSDDLNASISSILILPVVDILPGHVVQKSAVTTNLVKNKNAEQTVKVIIQIFSYLS